MMYIHNAIRKILHIMDFTKYGTHNAVHKLYMAPQNSIIIGFNKFSPNHSQLTLITVPSCQTQQSSYGQLSKNSR